MDENDALSEYNKIPLGHNRTNGAVYSKIYFKVENALHIRYSIVIPRFISRANTVFLTLLTTTTMFIVTI